MTHKLKTVLTIGGSDPGCGAGIQADILAISSMGLHPLSVITALTAQNSHGVSAVSAVTEQMFHSQLNAVLEDVEPDAIKTGMIGSMEIGCATADFIERRNPKVPLVVDPVMMASAGGMLLEKDFGEVERMLTLYIERIFPVADVITPNLPEALQVARIAVNEPERLTSHELALVVLEVSKAGNVVLKGGHSEGEMITDLLVTMNDGLPEFTEFSHKRVETSNLHGTGCLFSSLLASFLALGLPVKEAFLKTAERVSEIIVASSIYQLGSSNYGPMKII